MARPKKIAPPPDAPDLDEETAPVHWTAEPLEVWEDQYARWVAMQVRRIPHEEELQVAAKLRGRPITTKALRRTKRKKDWIEAYTKSRGDVMELQLQRAKAAAVDLIPSGVRTYQRAVEALDREFATAKANGSDAMPAIRAAAPLLTPIFDRALPKKQEAAEIAPRVVIQISPGTMARMEAPQIAVTALPAPKEEQDADYEIVSDRPAA